MIRNAIHICLWVVAIVVLYLPLREYFVNRAVIAELDHLNRLLGEFDIKDPSKICIRSLKTENHLEFAWRVYFPTNLVLVKDFQAQMFSNIKDSIELPNCDLAGGQLILRFRITPEEDRILVAGIQGPYSMATSRGLKKDQNRELLTKLLDPSMVVVRQAARDRMLEFDLRETVELLAIDVNDDYTKDAKTTRLFTLTVTPFTNGPTMNQEILEFMRTSNRKE